MRVYELAKELGTDSKTVIQILKENESIGTVKNHMSSVDENQKGVVKLGLKVETTKLAFTESDLDETSFDEYVDDDTKPSLYDVVKEDVEVAPIVTQGTAGTSAFATYSDEDRLETEEEIQKGTDYVFDHGHETLKPEEIQENDLLDQKHQGHDDLKTEAMNKILPILEKINLVEILAEEKNDKAIDFVKNVKNFFNTNYRITEKQMKGLNKVYKRVSEDLFEGDKND